MGVLVLIFLLWLAILSCRLLSLLRGSSAFFIALPLSRSLSFSFSLRFSSPTTLSLLSLSFPLLFSVFHLIHQLLTAFLSLSFSPHLYLRLPCVLLVSSFFSFLSSICPPLLCLSHSVSARSERSSLVVRGVRGDKQFCLCCCSLSAPAGLSVYVCIYLYVCVRVCVECVDGVRQWERRCYLARIGPGCCVTTH